MSLIVERPGFFSSVQDLGRIGLRQFGVSLGGALDPFALRVANLLVGNNESAAAFEITFGGLQLRFADERLVAWCGGEFDVRIGSTSLPAGHSAVIETGEELKFGHARAGCRCWLAVSGGIDVPIVLGSRSTDLRASFGGFEGARCGITMSYLWENCDGPEPLLQKESLSGARRSRGHKQQVLLPCFDLSAALIGTTSTL